ncbi:hypothetical protein CIX30_17615 [Salmonella enterica]|nr:hypothetical protein [Salmonella enterica]EBQ9004527.1 hypothetical protein [Salmonella enterica subsp. enterica serovar Blockley]ECS7526347.1 hypothetical protein [Salmonella enterica]ECW2125699.1 ash family protein [Salmonella enterica]
MFARKHLTSPRKIKATLVKRPVAFVIIEVNFHTIIVRTKNIFANCLRWLTVMSYAYPAPHKTGVGRGNPICKKATPDAENVFFCVRHMRHFMAWYVTKLQGLRYPLAALLSYHAAHNGTACGGCVRLGPVIDAQDRTPRRPAMVTLAGQPQGWPVSFLPGISTPVNVTALFERGNSSGDSLTSKKEAVYHG